MAYQAVTFDEVLQVVRQWPPAQRLSLVQGLLQTLAPELRRLTGGEHDQRNTLAMACGLLATGQPTPSDAEIKQWLDEWRMEKYS